MHFFFFIFWLRVFIIKFSACVELQTTRFALALAALASMQWKIKKIKEEESSDCDDVLLLWCALLIDRRARENTWHKFRCNFSDFCLYKYNCLCMSVLSLELNLNVRFLFDFFLSLSCVFFNIFNTLDLTRFEKKKRNESTSERDKMFSVTKTSSFPVILKYL